VPADGLYEFQVDSTWDATLVLAGEMIIDDTGTKGSKGKVGDRSSEERNAQGLDPLQPSRR
jgi:hypothetical protein